MNKYSILTISCTVFMLSSCDHYSTQLAALDSPEYYTQDVSQISPAAGGGMVETTFSGYLKLEYAQLARHEQDQYDYRAAKYYTKKAVALSQGTMVSPAALNDFEISPENTKELTSARQDLILALKTYNISENRQALAVAQSRYDCWLEQQEEGHKGYEIISCKTDFKHSMVSLTPPDNRDVRFPISFMGERLTLSEKSRASLEHAVSFWKANKARGYNVVLVPTSGVSTEENGRQISMIRSILQFNGVDASDISVSSANITGVFEVLLRYSEDTAVTRPSI